MSHNKMPHNNRVSSSVALKTNDMWSKTIGHDPYANMETESERKIQKEQHDHSYYYKNNNIYIVHSFDVLYVIKMC